MASSFQKTYRVTGEYKTADGSDIPNVAIGPNPKNRDKVQNLRLNIMQRIEEATRLTLGILNTQPGEGNIISSGLTVPWDTNHRPQKLLNLGI
jgi:hypothetical protein